MLSFDNAIPDQSKLKKFSGEIKTVVLVDDLSDEPTTMMSPLNAIQFALIGEPTVFRYPSRWPGYSDLYNRLAFEVDVWVDPDDLGPAEPVVIYRLEQTTPAGWETPPISVSYQAIVTAHQSYRKLGVLLLGFAPILFLVGYLVVRWNRRHRVIPKAD